MDSRKKTKICFVSGVIARSGGTERVGSIIASALAKDGYDVILLSCWNQGPPFFPLDKNVDVQYLLNPKTEGKLYRTYIYPIVKLHYFIIKNKIDVIVDIDTELARFTSYAIQGTSCKQISWEHFNYWTMLKLNEKKRFRAKRLIKRYASKLVVLTEEDRAKHIEAYNLSPDFVVTMPNPCLSEVMNNYSFSQKTFLSVGRLAPPKKISALLNAWAIIQDYCLDWQLVIVGKGELEEELKTQASKLNLHRVDFTGHTDHVEEYYRKASCFVLSSEYEGFPMVILEAQSYGIPVIAFDCKTGPRGLISDGRNGYLIEAGNVEKLAEKMLLFTKSEENACYMSENAVKDVQTYNLSSITKKWRHLIESVISGDSKDNRCRWR